MVLVPRQSGTGTTHQNTFGTETDSSGTGTDLSGTGTDSSGTVPLLPATLNFSMLTFLSSNSPTEGLATLINE